MTKTSYKFFDAADRTHRHRAPRSGARDARRRALGTATLHEAGGKIGALPPQIKPVDPSFAICGPAFTVHSPPGDNLWLHRAIAIAQPGDVLVVLRRRRLRARLLG